MLATWTGIAELALDDEEAKKLDGAIKRVMRHQQINLTQKQMDMANLAWVGASIYGPRAVAIYMGRNAAQKPAEIKQPENVFNFAAAPGA